MKFLVKKSLEEGSVSVPHLSPGLSHARNPPLTPPPPPTPPADGAPHRFSPSSIRRRTTPLKLSPPRRIHHHSSFRSRRLSHSWRRDAAAGASRPAPRREPREVVFFTLITIGSAAHALPGRVPYLILATARPTRAVSPGLAHFVVPITAGPARTSGQHAPRCTTMPNSSSLQKKACLARLVGSHGSACKNSQPCLRAAPPAAPAPHKQAFDVRRCARKSATSCCLGVPSHGPVATKLVNFDAKSGHSGQLVVYVMPRQEMVPDTEGPATGILNRAPTPSSRRHCWLHGESAQFCRFASHCNVSP